MIKITGLESEKAKLLKQVAKKKTKHKVENVEFRSKIKKLEKSRTNTTDIIAKLKAKVVKLRDNNKQTFFQLKILSEVIIISKKIVSKNE